MHLQKKNSEASFEDGKEADVCNKTKNVAVLDYFKINIHYGEENSFEFGIRLLAVGIQRISSGKDLSRALTRFHGG